MNSIVNAQSTAYLTVALRDAANAPAVPSALYYTLLDRRTEKVLRNNVSLTPASDVTITLSASDNALLSNNHRSEDRVLLLRAVYGADDELNAAYIWTVKNLLDVE